MTTNITIPLALLEQLVGALEECLDDAMQVQCDLEQSHYKNVAKTQAAQVARAKESLTAGRAALEGAEHKKFSVTNTSTGTLPQRIESIFEAMDKEVAAGRLVRTGPLEWSKT